MFAQSEDLEILLVIQRIDMEIAQTKKKRVELPQRIEVMRLRKKRDEIGAKLDQVVQLQKKAENELTLVEDDDRALAEKQQRAQELIDAAGSDYRKVESHSKEMASVAKRREDLEGKIAAARQQVDKVKAVRAQIENAIAASEAQEERLRADFEADDNALIDQIRQLTAQRSELCGRISPDLAGLYEKTRKKLGGVGIGKLGDDARCSVCRAPIEGGRLIELRASAPLGTCPHCKRLLVVEQL